MALDTFVAGSATGALASVALGLMKDGYKIQTVTKAQAIDETDGFAQTTLDFIYRGQDAFVAFQCRAWKAGPKLAIVPWTGVLGKISSAAVPVSSLASAVARTLVLTATANTPAALDPATLTAPGSILVPGFQAEWALDSRLREVPVRLQLLPYVSGSDLWHFALT
ncbi:unnamed protein product [Gemmataceae bacterium]|nr:unnamed protein product [Gemmataceae bacterium]VTT96563.1 unnamed protein product [Gemmataceae bacterium]